MKRKRSAKTPDGGVSVNKFAIPLLIVVVVLHVVVVTLIIDVNSSSNALSDLMKRSGNYQLDAVSLLTSNTVMSEACGNYLRRAGSGDPETDAQPLKTYAREFDADGRGSKVLERFLGYDVSGDVLLYIEAAAESSDRMAEMQILAVSLVQSVYPFPDSMPELSLLPLVDLTAEELEMKREDRVELARHMLTDGEYALLWHLVEENVENCNRTIQREMEVASSEAERRLFTLRLFLWVAMSGIISFLSVAFIMFYKLFVKPVLKYSEAIDENRSIEQVRAVAELRRLVNAHNSQLERRNKLENILRTAAETDALTGLPNRHCLERDLIEKEAETGAIGVLVFDVDFLKQTNDTKGHLAGDQLLRTTADCIKECFGTGGPNNCYRIGGDEFVALLKGCGEDEIRMRIERFALVLERENINVSVGYAHGVKTDADSLRRLIERADRQMYRHKRLAHEKRREEEGGN